MKNIMVKLYPIFLVLCLTGCSRSWVSQTVFYPPNTNYSSANYYLIISAEGAWGRSYTDRTNKNLYVTVKTNGKNVIFEKKYDVFAGNLRWYVDWVKSDTLHITLYEGEKINNLSQELAQRKIKSIMLILNKDSNKFIESMESDSLLSH